MRTIYKYPLGITDEFWLSLPKDAEILHIGVQEGMPMLWAIVDPEAVWDSRRLLVVGTGHLLPDGASKLTHVSTFQEGPFVWHVFEPLRGNGSVPAGEGE